MRCRKERALLVAFGANLRAAALEGEDRGEGHHGEAEQSLLRSATTGRSADLFIIFIVQNIVSR